MFLSTLVVLIAALAFIAGVLIAFIWAVRHDQFGDLDRQVRLPLEGRDLRLIRPWETAEQAEARRREWGDALKPGPGEWGGAR